MKRDKCLERILSLARATSDGRMTARRGKRGRTQQTCALFKISERGWCRRYCVLGWRRSRSRLSVSVYPSCLPCYEWAKRFKYQSNSPHNPFPIHFIARAANCMTRAANCMTRAANFPIRGPRAANFPIRRPGHAISALVMQFPPWSCTDQLNFTNFKHFNLENSMPGLYNANFGNIGPPI